MGASRQRASRAIRLGAFLALPLLIPDVSTVWSAVSQSAPLPASRFSLARLRAMLDPKATPRQKAEIGLGFLREEIGNPTATYPGLGGPINHNWIMAQITLAFWQGEADREIVWREYQQARPGEFRDALMLALGLMGDSRVAEGVIHYLLDTTRPVYLRQHAARALGDLQDLNAVPALRRVLSEDRTNRVRRKPGFEKYVRYFPVRDSARLALLRLHQRGTDIGLDPRTALHPDRVSLPVADGEAANPAAPRQ